MHTRKAHVSIFAGQSSLSGNDKAILGDLPSYSLGDNKEKLKKIRQSNISKYGAKSLKQIPNQSTVQVFYDSRYINPDEIRTTLSYERIKKERNQDELISKTKYRVLTNKADFVTDESGEIGSAFDATIISACAPNLRQSAKGRNQGDSHQFLLFSQSQCTLNKNLYLYELFRAWSGILKAATFNGSLDVLIAPVFGGGAFLEGLEDEQKTLALKAMAHALRGNLERENYPLNKFVFTIPASRADASLNYFKIITDVFKDYQGPVPVIFTNAGILSCARAYRENGEHVAILNPSSDRGLGGGWRNIDTKALEETLFGLSEDLPLVLSVDHNSMLDDESCYRDFLARPASVVTYNNRQAPRPPQQQQRQMPSPLPALDNKKLAQLIDQQVMRRNTHKDKKHTLVFDDDKKRGKHISFKTKEEAKEFMDRLWEVFTIALGDQSISSFSDQKNNNTSYFVVMSAKEVTSLTQTLSRSVMQRENTSQPQSKEKKHKEQSSQKSASMKPVSLNSTTMFKGIEKNKKQNTKSKTNGYEILKKQVRKEMPRFEKQSKNLTSDKKKVWEDFFKFADNVALYPNYYPHIQSKTALVEAWARDYKQKFNCNPFTILSQHRSSWLYFICSFSWLTKTKSMQFFDEYLEGSGKSKELKSMMNNVAATPKSSKRIK